MNQSSMQTRISEKVILTPQPWCRNPEGYIRHQKLLKQFAEWCEDRGFDIELPPERDGWDLGIDLIVANTRIDLKSFGLEVYSKSHTWSSPHYRGRRRPVWRTTQTDWFVHPNGEDVADWLAAPCSALRTSKWGHQPYYLSFKVMTVDKLAQGGFPRSEKQGTI